MSQIPQELLQHDKPSEVARWLALYRDDFTCRLCGAKENLHVHHIVPVSKGGGNPGNLVTLCNRCHRKVEGTKRFKKPKYRERLEKLKKKRGKQIPSTASFVCRCKYCDKLFDSMKEYFEHIVREEAKRTKLPGALEK